jgi:hypothetical protein
MPYINMSSGNVYAKNNSLGAGDTGPGRPDSLSDCQTPLKHYHAATDGEEMLPVATCIRLDLD